MLKALRKYNKWILVIGGTLLMIAFLVQPAIQQLQGDPGARLWATLDGKKLRTRDYQLAGSELKAIERLSLGYYPANLGLEERDGPRHWVLLVHEARQGGFVGEAEDGGGWLPELQAEIQMRQQFGGRDWRMLAAQNPEIGRFLSDQHTRLLDELTTTASEHIVDTASRFGLTVEQVHQALAKVRGVMRMHNAYVSAARVSDLRAANQGRRILDAAYVDYAFIPASVGVGAVADPDDATLGAFFDAHKSLKPGEGEHGIGYLLPERVKLEWLTLDAAAIESAVVLDPVAVNKRYLQAGKTRYPGEFAAERANVERDMKAERVAEIMQEAHRTIQAEVLRVTRRLGSDGRFKRVPADWESQRPKFEAIAPVVVEQVTKSTGVTIPLPTVNVRAAEWITRDKIPALEGVGQSTLQTGNLRVPFPDAVLLVRELLPPGTDAEITVPLQVGVPMVEAFFSGPGGSRSYVTVLDARRESAPDSAAEIRDEVVGDYKRVKAYEVLAGRVEEYRTLVAAEGFTKLLDMFAPPSDASDQARPDFRTRQRVTRLQAPADVDVEAFRDAVMSAAAGLDPLAPPDQFDASKATVGVPIPSKLGVVVARITALEPLTLERFRLTDLMIAAEEQREELMPGGLATDRPFSLARMLERHTFVSGEASPDLDEEAGETQNQPPASSGG